MDLLFLGTSSGTPTRTRNVTGLALIEEQGRGWHLIDCGEATQHQLLRSSLSLNDLQVVFITHVHGDHCYGLPGLLASAGMGGRRAPLTIVAPAGIEAWLLATQLHTQLFLPFDLRFVAAESLSGFQCGSLRTDSVALSHRVPSYAYVFVEDVAPRLDTARLRAEGVPAGPIWGQLQQGKDVLHEGRELRASAYLQVLDLPRKLILCGDNDCPELLRPVCAGAQVLVHEATYTADIASKVGPGVGHSHAGLVAEFARRVGIPNLVLTHFSPRYQPTADSGPSIQDIRQEAAQAYAGALFLAEDYARYRLGRNGEFRWLNAA